MAPSTGPNPNSRRRGPSVATLTALLLPLALASPAPAAQAAGPVVEGGSAPALARQVAPGSVVVIDQGRQPAWRGEPISLSLKDADLVEVLRSFARLAGVNLIIDPGVKGKVTLELKDVPWDQALYVILKTHGLAAEIDGRIWGVHPRGLLVRRYRQAGPPG